MLPKAHEIHIRVARLEKSQQVDIVWFPPFSVWGIRAVCAGPLQLPDTLLVNKTSIKQNNLPDKPPTRCEWRQRRERFRKSRAAATGRVFHHRRGREKPHPVIVSVWPTDHDENVITRVYALLIHPADWRLEAWLHLVISVQVGKSPANSDGILKQNYILIKWKRTRSRLPRFSTCSMLWLHCSLSFGFNFTLSVVFFVCPQAFLCVL